MEEVGMLVHDEDDAVGNDDGDNENENNAEDGED